MSQSANQSTCFQRPPLRSPKIGLKKKGWSLFTGSFVLKVCLMGHMKYGLYSQVVFDYWWSISTGWNVTYSLSEQPICVTILVIIVCIIIDQPSACIISLNKFISDTCVPFDMLPVFLGRAKSLNCGKVVRNVNNTRFNIWLSWNFHVSSHKIAVNILCLETSLLLICHCCTVKQN